MRKMFLFLSIFVVTLLNDANSGFAHGNQVENGQNFLEHYSFFELWNPFFLAVILLVFYGYFQFVKKSLKGRGLPIKKIVSFGLGLIIFYLALGSPLHVLGDSYLFSAHMLQQSLVYLLVPPLLLLGVVGMVDGNWFKDQSMIRFINKPLVLLIAFNVLFSLYHIPDVFEFLVGNTILHSISHIILTVSAFLMWIPIIPIVKELETLSEVQKIGYIFAGGVLLTPACALIIFADTPLYPTYITDKPLFSILPPLDDQELGGIIMKVFQEFVYGSIIGYIFFKWARKERKIDSIVDLQLPVK
jgi:putative membrane protein